MLSHVGEPDSSGAFLMLPFLPLRISATVFPANLWLVGLPELLGPLLVSHITMPPSPPTPPPSAVPPAALAGTVASAAGPPARPKRPRPPPAQKPTDAPNAL